MRHPQVIGAVMLGLLVVVGCGKKGGDAPADEPAPGPNANPGASAVPAQFVAARKTFDANCAKCHSTDPAGGGFPGGGFPGGGKGPPGFKGGPGGFKGKMSKGPNLAKAGASPEHTREWFVAYIRDPQSVKAKSRMPRFEGKLDEGQLGALADYLVSLK
jgi:mono/diheme cytochrome c family protein